MKMLRRMSLILIALAFFTTNFIFAQAAVEKPKNEKAKIEATKKEEKKAAKKEKKAEKKAAKKEKKEGKKAHEKK
jgi:hypothetical protein